MSVPEDLGAINDGNTNHMLQASRLRSESPPYHPAPQHPANIPSGSTRAERRQLQLADKKAAKKLAKLIAKQPKASVE